MLVKNSGTAIKQNIKKYQKKVNSVLYTAIILKTNIAYAAV
jgi:hypothetical protein